MNHPVIAFQLSCFPHLFPAYPWETFFCIYGHHSVSLKEIVLGKICKVCGYKEGQPLHSFTTIFFIVEQGAMQTPRLGFPNSQRGGCGKYFTNKRANQCGKLKTYSFSDDWIHTREKKNLNLIPWRTCCIQSLKIEIERGIFLHFIESRESRPDRTL